MRTYSTPSTARAAAAIVALLLVATSTLRAQDTPREWILGLHADATKLFSDFSDNRFSSGGALSLKRYVRPLGGDAVYGAVSLGLYDAQWMVTREFFTVYDTTSARIGDKHRVFMIPIDVEAQWRRRIGPDAELFLGTGLSLLYFSPQNPNGQGLDRRQDRYGHWTLAVPLTAEFDFMLSDRLALQFRSTMRLTLTDYLDGFQAGDGNDHFLTVGLGISYSFPEPDSDPDFDGLSTRAERSIHRTDPHNADTDGDGLRDGDELVRGTDPRAADTDGDGLSDGEEVMRWATNALARDTDGDGLGDLEEVVHGTSPLSTDSDGDGLNDKVELARGTDPRNRDTDGDGLPDGLENVSSPLLRDSDGDGLNDEQELLEGLRATDEDFDKDGLYDGLELRIGTDPKKPDTDNDGVSDYAEHYGLMTNPRHPDSDGDGVADGSDPSPLDRTPLNPARNVSWTLSRLFKLEEHVDETSKAYLLLLHLIRSAPREMLFNIDIAVYGPTSAIADARRRALEALLNKQMLEWSRVTVSLYSEVRGSGLTDARLVYVWKTGVK